METPMGRKKEFNLEDFLLNLEDKGFKFREDAIAFIYFGKKSTGCSDILAAVSIELTLKLQKSFDGSFYLSLLETFMEKGITTRKQALDLFESLGKTYGT
ncbi:MAG TPA: DUF6123 family protein [Bacillaceae bacterium]